MIRTQRQLQAAADTADRDNLPQFVFYYYQNLQHFFYYSTSTTFCHLNERNVQIYNITSGFNFIILVCIQVKLVSFRMCKPVKITKPPKMYTHLFQTMEDSHYEYLLYVYKTLKTPVHIYMYNLTTTMFYYIITNQVLI